MFSQKYFQTLPQSVISYIFEYFHFKELCYMTKINKHLRCVITKSMIFKNCIELLTNTGILIKKIPEMIYLKNLHMKEILKFQHHNDEQAIQNYLYYLMSNKQSVGFTTDKIYPNSDGLICLSLFLKYSLCTYRYLNFSNGRLPCGTVEGILPKEVYEMLSSLTVNNSVEEVVISRNTDYPNVFYRILGEKLAGNKKIHTLEITNQGLTDENAKFLLLPLVGNKSLISLNLSENSLGHFAGQHLSEFLKCNTSLKHLILEKNSLEDSGTQQLIEGLKHNTTLLSLDLSENKIGESGLKSILDYIIYKENNLSPHPSLCLKLRKNQLDERGIKIISKIIKKSCFIVSLDISENNLSGNRVIPIAKSLKMNSTLECLELISAKLGDLGMKLLGDGIKYNTGLKMLNLKQNEISMESQGVLNEVVQCRKNLETIVLSRNALSAELLNDIKLQLDDNRKTNQVYFDIVLP